MRCKKAQTSAPAAERRRAILLPVIGLILYLVWKDDTPLRARSCGRGAAVGFVIYFLLVLVCIILVIVGLFAFSEAMREGTRMALSALSFMGV